MSLITPNVFRGHFASMQRDYDVRQVFQRGHVLRYSEPVWRSRCCYCVAVLLLRRETVPLDGRVRSIADSPDPVLNGAFSVRTLTDPNNLSCRSLSSNTRARLPGLFITEVPARWLFAHLADDTWCWQRLRPGHDTFRSPTTHLGVSAAITDAIGHGFSPQNDHWIVDDTSPN